MAGILIRLSQISMWAGFFLAMAAQIAGFIRLIKIEPLKAVLALILPGYLLYYVWRSNDKMLGLQRLWVAGGIMFVVGALVVGLAMEI